MPLLVAFAVLATVGGCVLKRSAIADAAVKLKTKATTDGDGNRRKVPKPMSSAGKHLKTAATKIKEAAEFPGKVLGALAKIDPSKLGPILAAAMATTAVAGAGYAVTNEIAKDRLESQVNNLTEQVAGSDNSTELQTQSETLREQSETLRVQTEQLTEQSAELERLSTELGRKVTSEDLEGLAAVEDLGGLASLEDLEDLAAEGDLEALATIEDLEDLADLEDLKELATLRDLEGLATTEDLPSLDALTEALAENQQALVDSTTANQQALAESAAATERAISELNANLEAASSPEEVQAVVAAAIAEAEAGLAMVETDLTALEIAVASIEEFDPAELEAAAADALAASAAATEAQEALAELEGSFESVREAFFNNLVTSYAVGVEIEVERLTCDFEESPDQSLDPFVYGDRRGSERNLCVIWKPVLPQLPQGCFYKEEFPRATIAFAGVLRANNSSGSAGSATYEYASFGIGDPITPQTIVNAAPGDLNESFYFESGWFSFLPAALSVDITVNQTSSGTFDMQAQAILQQVTMKADIQCA